MTFEFGSEEEHQHIGAYLKRLRQERELSLAEIATELRIHEKYLGGLEENDDSLFPDRIYKELFLKSYAEYLGVSLEEVMLRLPDVIEPVEEEVKPVTKAPVAKVQKTPEPINRPSYATTYANPEPERSSIGRFVLVTFLLVVIIVLGFFLYKLTVGSRQEIKVATPTVQPEQKKEKIAVVESTVAVPDSSDSAMAQANGDSGSVVEPAPADSIYLLIIGKSRCWLRVRADADTGFFERTIKADDTLWFAMQDSISFRLGRANGVEVYFNALPLKLAESGDTTVASYMISRGNYQKYVDSSRLSP